MLIPVLLLLAGAAVAAVDLRAGVLVWIALAGTVAEPIYRVRTSGIYLSTALLMLLFLRWLGTRPWRGAGFASSRLELAVLTCAAVAVISSVLGNVFYDPDVPGTYWYLPVQVYATGLAVLSSGAALLVGGTLDRVGALRWMYRIIVAVGLLFLVAPLLPAPLFAGELGWWPLIGAHGAALLWATALCDSSKPLWLRAAGVGAIAYALLQVPVRQLLDPGSGQWLSGWIALVVPLVCITALVRWKVFAVAAISAAAALVSVGLPLMHRVIQQTRFEGGFLRPTLWLEAFHLALLRPLLGTGLGNYPDYMNAYGQGRILMTSAHGNYQQLAVETGFVGLAALVWVLVEAFVLGWRLYRRVEDPFLKAFALGVVGSLSGQVTASCFGDYLIPAYHNGGHLRIGTTLYTWMLIGGLIAGERIARRTANGERSTARAD